MNDFAVLRAKANDIAMIQQLEEQAFGFTWDLATFERELTRENGATVVAKVEERVVGSALLVWAAGEVQLNSIVLHPDVRGRGLSRWFLGALMHWSKCQLQNWFTLEVKWHNLCAHKLYRRLGFVTTACRRSYYRDGSDARIMWAGHLQGSAFERRLEPYSAIRHDLGTTI